MNDVSSDIFGSMYISLEIIKEFDAYVNILLSITGIVTKVLPDLDIDN
jgi:hypothetical protein